jgi:hypothetical protein
MTFQYDPETNCQSLKSSEPPKLKQVWMSESKNCFPKINEIIHYIFVTPEQSTKHSALMFVMLMTMQ